MKLQIHYANLMNITAIAKNVTEIFQTHTLIFIDPPPKSYWKYIFFARFSLI
jgi:hypothetical protein